MADLGVKPEACSCLSDSNEKCPAVSVALLGFSSAGPSPLSLSFVVFLGPSTVSVNAPLVGASPMLTVFSILDWDRDFGGIGGSLFILLKDVW
jgi:hypothetical protein